jgi:hypothetical protein
MTRITEHSTAYLGGVRKTFAVAATRFYGYDGAKPMTTCAIGSCGLEDMPGGIIPVDGSLELAWEEPDGSIQGRFMEVAA